MNSRRPRWKPLTQQSPRPNPLSFFHFVRRAPCRRYIPLPCRPTHMPSPSPGANISSSSGNGTPKLLNDYVRLQALLLCDFTHRGCLSNSAIVLGKAHLVRSIVRSQLLHPTAVSSLVLRCPQLGYGGDCCRKGDHIGQYTEGRDIPNHGEWSHLHHRPDRSVARISLSQRSTCSRI